MLEAKGTDFGGALAQGLKGGLLSLEDGVDQIGRNKYRQDILSRTRQGMERNAQIEAAQRGVLNPDGSLNQEKWGQWAQVDAPNALDFKQKLEGQKKGRDLGTPIYITSEDGEYEDPFFEVDGQLVPAAQFLRSAQERGQSEMAGGAGTSAAWDRAATKRSPISGGASYLLGDAAN